MQTGPFRLDSDAVVLTAFEAAERALELMPTDTSAFHRVDDATLVDLIRRASRLRDRVATLGAILAGEVARRSAPELGSAGLAQRTGFRTPTGLVKVTTGATGPEAVAAIRAGRLLNETAAAGTVDPTTGEVSTSTEPWLAPVAEELTSRRLSIAAADAIRSGLGTPNSAVTVEQLTTAAASLCLEAATLDPDRLVRRARQLRDELDEAGIAVREEERRQQRSLRLSVLPSGMGRLVWTMDPETLTTVKSLYDRMTSPKLGGVRFVAAVAKAKADAILADARTPEQLASDGFTQLLRAGSDTDPRFLLGSGAPVVTIITTKTAIDSRAGHGRIEGCPDPVSIETVDRAACDGGTIEVAFDEHGQPLDYGREHRLFTRRQKRALALRDGGCMAPGCDRPPSWTEAHHIRHWARDHGRTDIADGILLCRHHHLLFHNNHWEIIRDRVDQHRHDQHRHDQCCHDQYWLIPPRSIDPQQTPIPMPTRSAAIHDLERDLQHAAG
jgi:hypothetical protein